MNSELCINVWFVVDIGTKLCYNWSIKAYNLVGDDDSKTLMLKQLAETDYTTVPRETFPKSFQTIFEDVTIEGQIPISQINYQFTNNLDFFLQNLENSLPPIFEFVGNLSEKGKAIKQKIPESPLYVYTLLMENEFGEIKPFTTIANKNWYEKELTRIELEKRNR
jgi:hypothetical protein